MNRTLRVEESEIETLKPQIEVSNQPQTSPKITSAGQFFVRMASLTRDLKDKILYLITDNGCNDYPRSREEFTGLWKNLQQPDQNDFADTFAQTITFSFLTAKNFAKDDFLTRKNIGDYIPKASPFLRKLIQNIQNQDFLVEENLIRPCFDELCKLFNHTDLGTIWQKSEASIHLYENFLEKYDPAKRKQMGVYYTPKPVVDFIVRSVDEVLKLDFGIDDGLAGKKADGTKVEILDPAVGTGNFLLSVIDHVKEKFGGLNGHWSDYAIGDLLPRLNGFEIMAAPYTLAHLNIIKKLESSGVDINCISKPKNSDDEPGRINVFLTNSLEKLKANKSGNLFFGRDIMEEGAQAEKIKDKTPIMVVLGNPPYSGISNNNDKFIMDLIEDYKYVDGKHFGERKHWLGDDYVKFIRFGEHFIEKNQEGVLAFITNHSYLDNPTFRGMRRHLMTSFDKIYIINLHGNSLKKETSPDGSKDVNVFDIQAGVSIIIAIKNSTNQKVADECNIQYYDLYGAREQKYDFLRSEIPSSIRFQKLQPKAPNYFLVNKSYKYEDEYNSGIKLDELFNQNSTGIVTMGDSFVIGEKYKIEQNIKQLISGNFILEELNSKYGLGKNYGKWILENKSKFQFSETNLVKINYRPFDTRYIYNNRNVVWRLRENIMKNFTRGENLGLICKKGLSQSKSAPVFVTNKISDFRGWSCSGMQGGDYVTPLYIHPEADLLQESVPIPNLNSKLVERIENEFNMKLDWAAQLNESHFNSTELFAPIDLLDYIYAVLHSPNYREKYKEFLKIDFPRVSFEVSQKTFWELVNLGRKLRKLHLMENINIAIADYGFDGEGNNTVQKVGFQNERVYINSTQYFKNVSEEVWNFHIGGYQPAQKWLKDRKSRQLLLEDLSHYRKIILVLQRTIEIMRELEKYNF